MCRATRGPAAAAAAVFACLVGWVGGCRLILFIQADVSLLGIIAWYAVRLLDYGLEQWFAFYNDGDVGAAVCYRRPFGRDVRDQGGEELGLATCCWASEPKEFVTVCRALAVVP